MTQKTKRQGYQARVAEIGHEAGSIFKLWLSAYPELDSTWARSKLEGQYAQNPAGAGLCIFLEQDSNADPVGVQGLIRRCFGLGDKELVAGNFVDFVVDPAHRSLGPALELLKATMAAGRESTDILYALPNRKSEVIFRRVGMHSPGGLYHFVRPLRAASFVRKRLGGKWRSLRTMVEAGANKALNIESMLLNARFGRTWQWSEQLDFDSFFDHCWSDRRARNLLIGKRTSEILRWRYPPGGDFRISVAISRNTRHKEGYVIWRFRDARVQVSDFFCRDPASHLLGLLASFCWACRKLDAEAVDLEFAGPLALRNKITRAGFRDRGANPLFVSSGPISSLQLNNDALYLTGFDRDTD